MTDFVNGFVLGVFSCAVGALVRYWLLSPMRGRR